MGSVVYLIFPAFSVDTIPLQTSLMAASAPLRLSNGSCSYNLMHFSQWFVPSGRGDLTGRYRSLAVCSKLSFYIYIFGGIKVACVCNHLFFGRFADYLHVRLIFSWLPSHASFFWSHYDIGIKMMIVLYSLPLGIVSTKYRWLELRRPSRFEPFPLRK
jgi:hypothetical protein